MAVSSMSKMFSSRSPRMAKQTEEGLSARQLYRMEQKKKMDSRRSPREESSPEETSDDNGKKRSMRKLFSSSRRLSKGSSKLLRRLSRSFRKSKRSGSSMSESSPTLAARSISSTDSVDGSATDKKKRKSLKKVLKKSLSFLTKRNNKNEKATGIAGIESPEDSSTSPEDSSSSNEAEAPLNVQKTFNGEAFFVWENVPDQRNVAHERDDKMKLAGTPPKCDIGMLETIEKPTETSVLSNKKSRTPSSQSLLVMHLYTLFLFVGALSAYLEQQGTTKFDLAKLGSSAIFSSEFPSAEELKSIFFESNVLGEQAVDKMHPSGDLSELMWAFGGL